MYDKRCGGVITVKSTRKVEVVVEPIGYHFDASSTPATLGLAPGSYTLEINGETFASFVIEACPKPTTTTVPPVVVDIADPVVPPTTTAPARPDLPATR